MQEINEEKILTNDEIKEMVLELSKHLAYASELISKINANSDLEIERNFNWNAPHILSAGIDVDNKTKEVTARVHAADVIDNVGYMYNLVDRENSVFPFQKEVFVNGVKVYELCDSKPSEE